MLITRRTFLMGGVSTVALLGLSRRLSGGAAPVSLYDPAMASAAGAVAAMSKLLTQRGLIGLDFSDVKTVLDYGGRAVYGAGTADGPDRARVAADRALAEIRRAREASRRMP